MDDVDRRRAVPGTGKRIVQLTDWLPPEFSAVSQYALLIAEEEAKAGAHVTVIGLSSVQATLSRRDCGTGSVEIRALKRSRFDRESWLKRLVWTFGTNLLLVWSAWSELRRADQIRFTGSPPFLLHVLVPANLILRTSLLYRITDFYPECIIAALARPTRTLEAFRWLTIRLRRHVQSFEVLGHDMKARLLACGIDEARVGLRRDESPVVIDRNTRPLARPPQFSGRKLILYSGNFGAAHDVATFLDGYRRHHKDGSAKVVVWLNATGAGANALEAHLREEGLPYLRQELVPLGQLAALLVTPDAHLITLRPAFAGFVLPSKVFGCIESGRPILYIGPTSSDVHGLCTASPSTAYLHANVGDPSAVHEALEVIASREASEMARVGNT